MFIFFQKGMLGFWSSTEHWCQLIKISHFFTGINHSSLANFFYHSPSITKDSTNVPHTCDFKLPNLFCSMSLSPLSSTGLLTLMILHFQSIYEKVISLFLWHVGHYFVIICKSLNLSNSVHIILAGMLACRCMLGQFILDIGNSWENNLKSRSTYSIIVQLMAFEFCLEGQAWTANFLAKMDERSRICSESWNVWTSTAPQINIWSKLLQQLLTLYPFYKQSFWSLDLHQVKFSVGLRCYTVQLHLYWLCNIFTTIFLGISEVLFYYSYLQLTTRKFSCNIFWQTLHPFNQFKMFTLYFNKKRAFSL